MYISDLIQETVDQKLKNTFIGKTIQIHDIIHKEQTFTVKNVEFVQDDGDAWVVFTSETGVNFTPDGQGLDIWYEICGRN